MKYLLIGWLVIFAAGCGVTEKKYAFHDFGTVASSSVHQGRATVNVDAPTWLWDNRIRYRLLFAAPSEVRFYGLDRWIASPPELFEQLMNSAGIGRDYLLMIQLHDFEQQFDAPDHSRVVLRFSAEVHAAENNQKVAAKEFDLQQPTKTPDAAGAITGFTELAGQSAENIRNWLIGLSKHQH
jgi:cholesterol transport system auxiliary component